MEPGPIIRYRKARAGAEKPVLTRSFLLLVFFGLFSPEQALAQTMREQADRALHRLDTLSAKKVRSEAERAESFLRVAQGIFDIDHLAMMSLPQGTSLTRVEREEYLNAFRTHLSLAYVESVRRYGATHSRLVGVREAEGRPSIVVIDTHTGDITRRSRWVSCSTNGFKVCEIELEGVDVSARNRRDFARIVGRGGIAALLEALRSGALVRQ